jgi:2-polyprenyl-6-methoxyphenol hydroxylase-like FAD-dependent oxidoreductase
MLPRTPEVTNMKNGSDNHAIVLGGSIAGLLAARVLADAYDQVTVVDRDELPPGSRPRRGAPQARHIHALLARGQQVLEELFPGLTAELVGCGAPIGDVLGDARLLFGGHRLARAEAGLVALSASRPLLEDRIRARVLALPEVRLAPPSDAVGLRCSPDGRRITGVQLLRRADASAEEVIDADLVVDATGRGSRAPAWLQALGFGQPQVDRVRVDVGYVTRTYRLAPDSLDGGLACIHGPAPDLPRGGGLARLEGDTWILTLFGMLGDHPPKDRDGFDAFARSLRFPDIRDAIATAEPLDNPAAYRFQANVRRRYERMRHFPEGFLVMGDALCSLNPIYGQGMTVAALQARALRDHLGPGIAPRSRRLLRALARAIDAPWELAIGADLALPGVDGRRTPRRRIAGAYVNRLQAAAADNPALARAFVRVTGLVDRPEALLRPAVALRVLRPRLHATRSAEGRRDAIDSQPCKEVR